MRTLLACVVACACLVSGVARAQAPLSPAPFATGNTNSWDVNTNAVDPGDEHGAVGRRWIVLKANREITFIPRALVQSGYYPYPPYGIQIPDAQFWPTTLPNTSVITPESPGAGLPTVWTVTPKADG